MDLLNKGDFHEAEPVIRAVAETTHAQHNAEAFVWERRLAECLLGTGNFSEAEKLARSAAREFGRHDPTDEDALDCQYLMAESLYGMRKSSDADTILQSVLPNLQGNMRRGPEHAVTLKCAALRAVVLQAMGKSQDAKALAASTAELLESVQRKSDTSASQGNRRPTASEKTSTLKVKALLAKVLKDYGTSEEESAKKHFAPDAQDGLSTCSTREPSKETK
jgi:hypothetical protein